ncbi:hypothetical protein chiPu_0029486, partial [Chiloscyllium punctatum]|nr:hypothetical protein [Chiloscyllium punctatum]
NPSSFLDVMESRVDTIQVRGTWITRCAPSSGSEAADLTTAPERELLMTDRAPGDIGDTSWQGGKCAGQDGADSPQDLRLTKRDPEGEGLPDSHHDLVPGPKGQSTVRKTTPEHSYNHGTACGGQRLSGQGTGQSCIDQLDQGTGLGSTLAEGCPLTTSDQSYITMSNLYKIQ